MVLQDSRNVNSKMCIRYKFVIKEKGYVTLNLRTLGNRKGFFAHAIKYKTNIKTRIKKRGVSNGTVILKAECSACSTSSLY